MSSNLQSGTLSTNNTNVGTLTGTISAGRIVLNDYVLNVSPTDDGCKITATRGSEVQEVVVLHGIPATHEWIGTTLHITTASGTTSMDLKGDKGETGEKGDTGFSPTVTITPIENGNAVLINDVNGSQNFNIMNGADGLYSLSVSDDGNGHVKLTVNGGDN